jgi:hypothetical protein
MDFIVVTKWEYPNLGDDNRICRNFSYYQTNKINKISHDSLIQKAFVIFNFVNSFIGSFGECHVYNWQSKFITFR